MEDRSTDVAPLSLEHVLLPLDGSPFAAAALPTARALADRFRARLSTISVAADEDEAAELRAQAVEAVGRDAEGSAEVAISDDPAQAIVGRAAELDSCVVCMSTRGRGRVTGAVLGSVARAVLQSSHSPVVALGPQADRPTALVGRPRRRPSNWPDPLSVGGIVACVDGSPASEAVLPVAARWAVSLEVSLSIVTVADDAAATAGVGQRNRFGPSDPKQYVEQLASQLRGVPDRVVGEVVFDPIGIASGLRAHLAAKPAALVALATHARSGLDRLRAGATAADIVRNSTAPALVVPVPAT